LTQTRQPVIFGEVLFDRFPDGHAVLGGAPFNVAWHLAAFGQAPLFISRVGNDPLGRTIHDAMRDWGMTTAGLQQDSQHPTGTVDVSFEAGEPNYDIVADRAYDHIDAEGLPPLRPALIYHGTLALRQAGSAGTLSRLKQRYDAPVFLDINLRSPWWNSATVTELLADARWIKLNADELEQITGDGGDDRQRARGLFEHERLELLVITRGAKGAEILSRDGDSVTVEPEAVSDVIDTVGAGDAFTSAFILGLLHNWPLATTAKRAQNFASALVQVRGATVQDPEFYRPFLENWGLSR
jgi:fructokinase